MKVRARYRPKNSNPFEFLEPMIAKIDVDVPDNTTIKELETLAKQATPKGHEFIEVLVLTD